MEDGCFNDDQTKEEAKLINIFDELIAIFEDMGNGLDRIKHGLDRMDRRIVRVGHGLDHTGSIYATWREY